jgi:hypothetical protein
VTDGSTLGVLVRLHSQKRDARLFDRIAEFFRYLLCRLTKFHPKHIAGKRRIKANRIDGAGWTKKYPDALGAKVKDSLSPVNIRRVRRQERISCHRLRLRGRLQCRFDARDIVA